MPYVRSTDGCRIHYEVTGRESAPPVLMIQGLGMDKHGWDHAATRVLVAVPRHRVRQPGRRPQRQAASATTTSTRWPGRGRRARRPRDRAGPCRRCVDGRRDRPDPRRDVPGPGPFADAGVHGVPQPAVAQRAARGVGGRRAAEGVGAMAGKAARWVIGPRSFRRVVPVLGWLGPLGFGRSGRGVRRPGRRRSSPPTTSWRSSSARSPCRRS